MFSVWETLRLIEKCTECFETRKKCECPTEHFMEFLGSKEASKFKKKENKVPDVQEIIKGHIGGIFVESIIYENQPCFLVNDNGKIRKSSRETIDGVIYAPLPYSNSIV